MIKGILFDFGSTLMYFDAKWEEVDQRGVATLVDFLRAHGIAVGDEFPSLFRAARERGWKLAEQTNVEHTVEDALHETWIKLGHTPLDGLLPHAVAEYFAEGEQYWLPYPDALETLRTLHARGLRLGLISNADDDGIVQRQAARLGFAPYLHPILSSAAPPKWRKPDPRIFHLVADEWRLPPHEIVMVGDATMYDIVGAHRAGMRGILIDRGDNAPWQKIPNDRADDPLVKPDATVRALVEIPAVIERL